MSFDKSRVTASFIGAIGVILWATETLFVTFTTRIPPLETLAIAFSFAAATAPVTWIVTRSSPFSAFRQPRRIWLLTVGALVGYHACIYYATQRAPAAAAALLQGTTPLMIVLGSAFLPGERLRWWHVAGATLGFAGVISLIDIGSSNASFSGSSTFYLCLIGFAAALWGIYSVITRTLPDVPSSTLGVFYAASAIVSFSGHFAFEEWVAPSAAEWLAMAALGLLPMGLAIYFWDHGLKRGDVQALGAFSYIEPFIGAVLVAVFTKAALDLSMLWSGALVVSGAILASASLWRRSRRPAEKSNEPIKRSFAISKALAGASSTRDLALVNNSILERLIEIGNDYENPRRHDEEIRELLQALEISVGVLDQCSALGLAAPATRPSAIPVPFKARAA